MANIYKRFKRKNRTSDSDLETISPEEGKEKSLWDEASHMDDAITDSPGEEDKIIEALDMTQSVASQLQLILSKLEALETKFETVVTTVNTLTFAVEDLKKTVDKVQSEMVAVESKTTELRKDVDQMDNSLSFLNKEVQELRSKENNYKLEIKSLESKILYQEVYNRRENLRFLNLPEASDEGNEDTKEVVYRFLERELKMEDVRRIEFQRIHRIGKKSSRYTRPVIARFLRFQDRELVFNAARGMRDLLEVKVLADLPKEVRERRKNQWPKLRQARAEGKRAFFSWQEPDKLYIDGILAPE